MEKKDLIEKYNISEKELEQTGLTWDELMAIKEDYIEFKEELYAPAEYIVSRFLKADKVHSVRYRIKDTAHLMDKIIRKRLLHPDREINLQNYRTQITDLIGIRMLHLFKEDILPINDFLTSTWELHESPVAYVREGDPKTYREGLESFGCNIQEHPYGYRSVHYLLKTKPTKTEYLAEIQVRTIYEEAWSEIDHKVRYPHTSRSQLLDQYLSILNNLSGNADLMSSHVKQLQNDLTNRKIEEKNLAGEIQKLKTQLETAQRKHSIPDYEHIFRQISKIYDITKEK
ncbi:RelA/SpoT domain-containing protein [Sediminitomix flava]|uniref:PpGpp synthetase/RelA/SpoT-type nucleotidyltransferase n=1 Tax=Sediminitomix flava TaxID=379075 RepID=A0A315Z992_SEDFL|nr:GTP pyrophosphokinase [Sediminitomix flava]PWJ40969.1 ppGpp synthetase/RelA/SpoT-type nucleotidyltransferase [Sediminitomix flava]